MEQMKKEIESLKKKTFYLQLLITVTLINVIFFSITQTRQYCSVMSYYRQDSIDSDCEDCEESKD